MTLLFSLFENAEDDRTKLSVTRFGAFSELKAPIEPLEALEALTKHYKTPMGFDTILWELQRPN